LLVGAANAQSRFARKNNAAAVAEVKDRWGTRCGNLVADNQRPGRHSSNRHSPAIK
jgi:hypothetical protein